LAPARRRQGLRYIFTNRVSHSVPSHCVPVWRLHWRAVQSQSWKCGSLRGRSPSWPRSIRPKSSEQSLVSTSLEKKQNWDTLENLCEKQG
jgi:hypothetical protein